MVMLMTLAHTSDTQVMYLSPREARDRLGVSRRTFQRYVERGLIAASHRLPNGHARFSSADVDSLCATEQAS